MIRKKLRVSPGSVWPIIASVFALVTAASFALYFRVTMEQARFVPRILNPTADIDGKAIDTLPLVGWGMMFGGLVLMVLFLWFVAKKSLSAMAVPALLYAVGAILSDWKDITGTKGFSTERWIILGSIIVVSWLFLMVVTNTIRAKEPLILIGVLAAASVAVLTFLQREPFVISDASFNAKRCIDLTGLIQVAGYFVTEILFSLSLDNAFRADVSAVPEDKEKPAAGEKTESKAAKKAAAAEAKSDGKTVNWALLRPTEAPAKKEETSETAAEEEKPAEETAVEESEGIGFEALESLSLDEANRKIAEMTENGPTFEEEMNLVGEIGDRKDAASTGSDTSASISAEPGVEVIQYTATAEDETPAEEKTLAQLLAERGLLNRTEDPIAQADARRAETAAGTQYDSFFNAAAEREAAAAKEAAEKAEKAAALEAAQKASAIEAVLNITEPETFTEPAEAEIEEAAENVEEAVTAEAEKTEDLWSTVSETAEKAAEATETVSGEAAEAAAGIGAAAAAAEESATEFAAKGKGKRTNRAREAAERVAAEEPILTTPVTPLSGNRLQKVLKEEVITDRDQKLVYRRKVSVFAVIGMCLSVAAMVVGALTTFDVIKIDVLNDDKTCLMTLGLGLVMFLVFGTRLTYKDYYTKTVVNERKVVHEENNWEEYVANRLEEDEKNIATLAQNYMRMTEMYGRLLETTAELTNNIKALSMSRQMGIEAAPEEEFTAQAEESVERFETFTEAAPAEEIAEPVEAAAEETVEQVETAAEEAVEEIAEPVEAVAEETAEQIETAAEEVTEQVETAAEEAVEAVAEPVETVTEEVTEQVEAAAEEATEQVETAVEEAVEAVAEPVETVTEEVTEQVEAAAEEAVEQVGTAAEEAVEEIAKPVEAATEEVKKDPANANADILAALFSGRSKKTEPAAETKKYEEEAKPAAEEPAKAVESADEQPKPSGSYNDFLISTLFGRKKEKTTPAAPVEEPVEELSKAVAETVEETAEAVAEAAEETTEAVTETIEETAEAVTDTVEEATENAAETAEEEVEAVTEIPEAIEEATEAAAETVEETVEAATETAEEAVETVTEIPETFKEATGTVAEAVEETAESAEEAFTEDLPKAAEEIAAEAVQEATEAVDVTEGFTDAHNEVAEAIEGIADASGEEIPEYVAAPQGSTSDAVKAVTDSIQEPAWRIPSPVFGSFGYGSTLSNEDDGNDGDSMKLQFSGGGMEEPMFSDEPMQNVYTPVESAAEEISGETFAPQAEVETTIEEFTPVEPETVEEAVEEAVEQFAPVEPETVEEAVEEAVEQFTPVEPETVEEAVEETVEQFAPAEPESFEEPVSEFAPIEPETPEIPAEESSAEEPEVPENASETEEKPVEAAVPEWKPSEEQQKKAPFYRPSIYGEESLEDAVNNEPMPTVVAPTQREPEQKQDDGIIEGFVMPTFRGFTYSDDYEPTDDDTEEQMYNGSYKMKSFLSRKTSQSEQMQQYLYGNDDDDDFSISTDDTAVESQYHGVEIPEPEIPEEEGDMFAEPELPMTEADFTEPELPEAEIGAWEEEAAEPVLPTWGGPFQSGLYGNTEPETAAPAAEEPVVEEPAAPAAEEKPAEPETQESVVGARTPLSNWRAKFAKFQLDDDPMADDPLADDWNKPAEEEQHEETEEETRERVENRRKMLQEKLEQIRKKNQATQFDDLSDLDDEGVFFNKK